MGQYLEYFKIALANIRGNRGRSFLTMLGIIIGISSVIMVVSIGNGMSAMFVDAMADLGTGQIFIERNEQAKRNDVYFDEEGLAAVLERVEHVKGVTPEIVQTAKASNRKGTFTINAYGGSATLEQAFVAPHVKRGRYFTENDVEAARRVCVIGEDMAMKLFGTANAVGLDFDLTINNKTASFTVIGVRPIEKSFVMLLFGDGEEAIEIPYTVLGSCFDERIDYLSSFLIIADSPETLKQVAKDSFNVLEDFYHVQGEDKITMSNIEDEMSVMDTIMAVLTAFVSLVAAISLVVGGVGVMNIMLVSVTERTREIGIRKSLGARTGSILLQFLAEAGIITLLGGIIGIILGSLGAVGICAVLGFRAKVKVSTVIVSAVFSAAVGIFFGMYPAKRAAQLTPIEALRTD